MNDKSIKRDHDDLLKARRAKVKLKEIFDRSATALPLSGIGLSRRGSGKDYFLKVGVTRPLTAAESAAVPKDVDGLEVKVRVTGVISPRKARNSK